MQHTTEQRIFVVTNYLKTRSFKEVQHFFKNAFEIEFRGLNLPFVK